MNIISDRVGAKLFFCSFFLRSDRIVTSCRLWQHGISRFTEGKLPTLSDAFLAQSTVIFTEVQLRLAAAIRKLSVENTACTCGVTH